jgi:hypothetical protein
MTRVTLGNRKYDSYAAAALAAGIPYMVFYLRLKGGWTPKEAANTPVRAYAKKRKVKAKAKAKVVRRRPAVAAVAEQLAA